MKLGVVHPALPADVKIPKFYPHNMNYGLELTPDEALIFVNRSTIDYVAVYRHQVQSY